MILKKKKKNAYILVKNIFLEILKTYLVHILNFWTLYNNDTHI